MSEQEKIKVDSQLSESMRFATREENLQRNLVYISDQLTEHLAQELSKLQQDALDSQITNRVIQLAEVTALFLNLIPSNLADINAVIKNTMSE